jgi:hypothetical protein
MATPATPEPDAVYRDKWKGWDLNLEFTELNGRLEVTGLTIRSTRRDKPITTTGVMRALPLQEIADDYRRRRGGAMRMLASHPDFDPDDRARMIARADQWLAGRATGRPTLYGAEHYAEVADVYLAARASSLPGGPLPAVAKHFHISRSSAARHVATAREMGLLGDGGPGHTSTPPTPKRRKKGPR